MGESIISSAYHTYPTRGTKSIVASIAGKGLKTPMIRNFSVDVYGYNTVDVPEMEVEGFYSCKNGDPATVLWPEAWRGLPTGEQVRMQLDFGFAVTGRITGPSGDAVGYGVDLRVGGADTGKGLYVNYDLLKSTRYVYMGGLNRYYLTITSRVIVIMGGQWDYSFSLKKNYPEVLMNGSGSSSYYDFDFNEQGWSLEFDGVSDYPNSGALTSKKIRWLSYPSGCVAYGDGGSVLDELDITSGACGYNYAYNMGRYADNDDDVVATDVVNYNLTVGPWSYRELSLT